MNTIVLNGSPKGNVEKCGSYLLAKAFVSRMTTPCEIHSIAKENRESLMDSVRRADCLIMIAPNYIHSIPSGALAFLHALPRSDGQKSVGFIIQSGYPESSESEIVCRYLKWYCERLGYEFLGAVSKGECAGLAIMPDRYKKLLHDFSEFGVRFDKTGRFDEAYVDGFAKPVRLSKFLIFLLNALVPVSKAFGWNMILKANHAYERRLDMPYLERAGGEPVA